MVHVIKAPGVTLMVNPGTNAPSYTVVSLRSVADGIGFTSRSKVALVAHWPAVGVKVYVPLTVLSMVAGDHVPVIPLVELTGRTGTVAPIQID